MNAESRIARATGALYIPFFALVFFLQSYIPAHIDLQTDAATLLQRIVDNEQLFRLSLAAQLLNPCVLLVIVVLLYKLFGNEHRTVATLMLVSVAIFGAIVLTATIHRIEALALIGDEQYRAALGATELAIQVKMKVDISEYRCVYLLWGTWLVCFGYLLFKSPLLPSMLRKALGLMLMIGSCVWFFESVRSILLPDLKLSPIAFVPTGLGEIGAFLWLLIAGVKRRV